MLQQLYVVLNRKISKSTEVSHQLRLVVIETRWRNKFTNTLDIIIRFCCKPLQQSILDWLTLLVTIDDLLKGDMKDEPIPKSLKTHGIAEHLYKLQTTKVTTILTENLPKA